MVTIDRHGLHWSTQREERGSGHGAATRQAEREVDVRDGGLEVRHSRDENATARQQENSYPGAGADKPTQIPKAGWVQIVKRAVKELSRDQMPLIAAGVAFYAFLSLVPTLIAATMLYGLVTDPEEVERQIDSMAGVLPESAQSLVGDQMTALASANQRGLGLGLIISLALALWSASGGVGNLITAVNLAYDEEETRGFVKRKALALGLTIAAIVFFALTFSLVAVFPAVANALDPPAAARLGLQALRWVVILLLVTVALAVLYRVAPDRDDARIKWLSVGAVVATVAWVVAAIGFSLYVDNFGSYGKTYGSLAGVVVLLLWLWLSILVVLLGAEINAEAEQQTVRDTTKGPNRPLGQRNAVKADTLPSEASSPPRR
jgi:membrane protein